MEGTANKNDFSKGSISKNIMALALPMTVAQLINVLYNVVDRIYIGHIPNAAALALTGLGLTFPIIAMVTAFTNLFGMGGAPLCSIARGEGKLDRAENIMGNSFTLLITSGVVLTILGLLVKKPVLYLFGASDATFPYADAYLSIYLMGSIFVMIGLGMNSFISAQGFGKISMTTVLLGAVTNIILDPIFIFVLKMGVAGAALATIISQGISAIWVMRFLLGDRAVFRLKIKAMKLQPALVREIIGLGMSSFIMAITNSVVQVVCNASLKQYGGDLYVGVMTIINSVREVLSMPVNGITSGAQPVLGYNYGAKEYRRVRKGILFTSGICAIYTTLVWLVVMKFPEVFIHLFNSDSALVQAGAPAMNIYFFGFFMMSLQSSGQSAFLSLGYSKQAIFFSLFRKVIIVVPLTLILPKLFNLGVAGVFLAEPISNFIGGTACFSTMMLTVWSVLKRKEEE